jgi:hypothetical protein
MVGCSIPQDNQSCLISKDIAAAASATAASIMILDVCVYIYNNIIMSMSPLTKSSSSPFQSACVRLNPYDLQHHCEKQIPFCIHDKSILLLGHLGAFYRRIEDA